MVINFKYFFSHFNLKSYIYTVAFFMKFNKTQNAWAFYDWANSVYPLIISSATFPIYYGLIFPEDNQKINVFGMNIESTALIFYVTALAFLFVSFLSPMLSGIADYVGNKKRFLQFFCYMGALSCMGLFWFTAENVLFGITCFFFGLIGFWGSLVFYNSYLPDIATIDQQDRLSARGFSMGYIGSVILLIVCLAFIIGKEGKEALFAMRLSFLATGIWWLSFSQYAFYHLPKGRKTNQKLTKDVFFNGLKELKKVQKELYYNYALFRYLTAFFVFSMAVQTVMLVATYFGEKEISWGSDSEKTMGLIISILVIQLVAVLGATLTSRASEKFGNIKTLVFILFLWSLICVYAYFIQTPMEFYTTASFVGLVMGGVQALARSTYSKMLPLTEDTTSFFSFYEVTEKIGIVVGMITYATILQVTGSMRLAIILVGIFFVTGFILLRRVPKAKDYNL